MNENKYKLRIGTKGERSRQGRWISGWIKPSGKFYKRLFNKKVRKGLRYRRGNWLEWC